jgi:hypothetical protein
VGQIDRVLALGQRDHRGSGVTAPRGRQAPESSFRPRGLHRVAAIEDFVCVRPL